MESEDSEMEIEVIEITESPEDEESPQSPADMELCVAVFNNPVVLDSIFSNLNSHKLTSLRRTSKIFNSCATKQLLNHTRLSILDFAPPNLSTKLATLTNLIKLLGNRSVDTVANWICQEVIIALEIFLDPYQPEIISFLSQWGSVIKCLTIQMPHEGNYGTAIAHEIEKMITEICPKLESLNIKYPTKAQGSMSDYCYKMLNLDANKEGSEESESSMSNRKLTLKRLEIPIFDVDFVARIVKWSPDLETLEIKPNSAKNSEDSLVKYQQFYEKIKGDGENSELFKKLKKLTTPDLKYAEKIIFDPHLSQKSSIKALEIHSFLVFWSPPISPDLVSNEKITSLKMTLDFSALDGAAMKAGLEHLHKFLGMFTALKKLDLTFKIPKGSSWKTRSKIFRPSLGMKLKPSLESLALRDSDLRSIRPLNNIASVFPNLKILHVEMDKPPVPAAMIDSKCHHQLSEIMSALSHLESLESLEIKKQHIYTGELKRALIELKDFDALTRLEISNTGSRSVSGDNLIELSTAILHANKLKSLELWNFGYRSLTTVSEFLDAAAAILKVKLYID